MIRRSLHGMLVVLTVSGVSARAETRGSPHSHRDIKAGHAAVKQTPTARKSCPEYGPDFIRLEGSSTCVRIGGGISIGGGIRR
jgi:hypothetical protein